MSADSPERPVQDAEETFSGFPCRCGNPLTPGIHSIYRPCTPEGGA